VGMTARIYRPAKTATQSGRGNTRHWILEFDSQFPQRTDSLTGWIGSDGTQQQVRMKFPSSEAAVAFAERSGIGYTLVKPSQTRVRKRTYADNFRHDKIN